MRLAWLLVAPALAACSASAGRPRASTPLVAGPPLSPVTPAAAAAAVVVPPGVDGALARAAAARSAACAQAPLLELGRTVRATTAGALDAFHAGCAYGAAAPDAVYRVHLERASHLAVRVSGSFDTAVHLRSVCTDEDSVFACNDDAGDERHSAIDADLPAGDYFAVVDGYASASGGFYTVTARATAVAHASAPRGIERVPEGEGATVSPGAPGAAGIAGTVRFAKRAFTSHGLTRATTDQPAPHAVVEAVDAAAAPREGLPPRVLAAVETDETGAFSLAVPAGATVRVRVLSRTRYLGNDVRVVSDPGTERLYELSTHPFRVRGGELVALRAGVGGVEPAGAFNVLAQCVKYLAAAHAGLGHALPPLYAFWRRGNNRSLPQGTITAFLMDYHRHEGTFSLQIQGGEQGHEDESDSDQFDDPVVLHEFTHFVVHTQAGNFSLGGRHRGNELYFPGLALDEGGANALATAVAGDGHYWDTAGLEPTGEVLVDFDSETMPLPVRGIGSQQTAQAILWDLIDGADGIPDRDHDGVAIGFAGVLRIYGSFGQDGESFPAVHTILERAASLRLAPADALARLVHAPQEHGFHFPVPTSEQWPEELSLPGEVRGRIDGATQPAPSGGANAPTNGFDAVRAYRLRVERRGMVYLDLAIDGAGTRASNTQLALQLVTRTLVPVASSVSEGAAVALHRIVDPGAYIVLVRDAAGVRTGERVAGNRASFTLRARPSTTFH